MALIKKLSSRRLFLKLAKPDDKGFSRIVNHKEFIGEYKRLVHNNGASWCRRESKLSQNYKVVLLSKNRKIRFMWDPTKATQEKISTNLYEHYDNLYKDEMQKGSKVISYKLCGFNKTYQSIVIHPSIVEQLYGKPCAMLNINATAEITPKNGRRNNPDLFEQESQKVEDFQVLSRGPLYAKREHCKQCKKTGDRFDATILGLPISYTSGKKEFGDNDNSDGCVGCYWYDIEDFNRRLSSIKIKVKKNEK